MNEPAAVEPIPCDIDTRPGEVALPVAVLARLAASAGEHAYLSFIPRKVVVPA